MVSFILLFDVGETPYLAVCGNTHFLYSYSRDRATLLLPPYFLDASYSPFPLPDPSPLRWSSPSGLLGGRTWVQAQEAIFCPLPARWPRFITLEPSRPGPKRDSPEKEVAEGESQESPPERPSFYTPDPDHRDPTATSAGADVRGAPSNLHPQTCWRRSHGRVGPRPARLRACRGTHPTTGSPAAACGV